MMVCDSLKEDLGAVAVLSFIIFIFLGLPAGFGVFCIDYFWPGFFGDVIKAVGIAICLGTALGFLIFETVFQGGLSD